MNGFKVFQQDDAIEKFENNAGIFSLLVQDKELEIFESIINKGKSILCQPSVSIDSLNIIMVTSGKLFHTNTKTIISGGERITFKNIDTTHHISVLEDTKVLQIRSGHHFIEQASTTDKVYNLIHQIQIKDQYTEDHCNSTGNLAAQIATLMKLPESSIINLLHASKLHDVGKIRISESILNKPSKLSHDEYEIIKEHPLHGFNIIQDESDNDELARIVLEHHERLDGSGYPNGLKGDEISIEAKILAVSDSFDAMISERPYKSKMTKDEAIIELKNNINTWYDASVVATLEQLAIYL